MKYLLPDVIYPNVYNEERENSIQRQYKLYDLYLKRIKSKIGQKLYEYYHIADRFHDYSIEKIAFCNAKEKEKSFIELNLNFYNDIFYRLTFFQIRKYTIEYSPEEKYYKNMEKKRALKK